MRMTRKPKLARITFFSLFWTVLGAIKICAAAAPYLSPIDLDKCGKYLVQGTLIDSGNSYRLIVHPRTDSEIRIGLRLDMPESHAALYLQKRVQAELTVEKKNAGAEANASLTRIVGLLPGPAERAVDITFIQAQACSPR